MLLLGLGTVGYLAPEFLESDDVDERSDIFSFGVLAYELLSYQRPFAGSTFVRISFRVLNEEPTPLARLVPEGPPALIRMVETCLKKTPADRYSSFHEIVDVLIRLMEDSQARRLGAPGVAEPEVAEPNSSIPTGESSATLPTFSVAVPRGRRGRPGLWVLGVMMLVVAGIGFASWSLLREQAEPSPSGREILAGGSVESRPAAKILSETTGFAEAGSEDPHREEDEAGPAGASHGEINGDRGISSSDGTLETSSEVTVGPEPTGRITAELPDRGKENETIRRVSSVPGANRTAGTATGPKTESDSRIPGEESVVEAASEPRGSTVPREPVSVFQEKNRPSSDGEDPPRPAPGAVPADSDMSAATSSEAMPMASSRESVKILPELIEQVQPVYPARARRRRAEATVILGVRVDTEGKVIQTLLKSSTVHGLGFEEAAEKAARGSRFRPGTVDEERKAMWTEMAFQFRQPG